MLAIIDRHMATEFQSTRPRGARQVEAVILQVAKVSIHAPTGGATGGILSMRAINVFQSTRPRGARPWPRCSTTSPRVSIHAPTGGATLAGTAVGRSLVVSIHAPTGGATQLGRQAATAAKCFNPRAHGGRDMLRHRHSWWMMMVSIHAPTGGATDVPDSTWREFYVSIHAPTGGATR